MPNTAVSRVEQQHRILARAAQSARHLSDVLEDSGWSYNDLVYENSRGQRWRGRRPLSLEDCQLDQFGVPVVSFFTGCGGMDLGFEAVGFRHVAAFEINELFCATLRHNRSQWKVFGPPVHSGDVSAFDEVQDTLDSLIRTPFEGVFIGGPPCQPFSIAANQRFAKWGDNFKRTGFDHETNGNLLFDYIRLILEFMPRAFVIENVPGLRDVDGGRQLRKATNCLEKAGYSVVDPFVLDAANFGIPQQRLRLFVIGYRGKGKFVHPKPQFEQVGAGSVLLNRRQGQHNSETREHKAESILRYMALDYGQRDHLGRVDRLDPALPSKTVIAGGTRGGGRSHLHPEIPRTLSVRECARLQTFPDDYVFLGATARQFTQVGNAVPPVLAAQIARLIRASFF